MRKIRSFINQNLSLIITILIIIIFAFLGLKLLNYFTKIQNEEQLKNANTTIKNNYNRDYQIMSGETKDENSYKRESNVIEVFINYCTNKKYEQAYDLVSENCKNTLFPKIEDFIEEYVTPIFTKTENYNIQAWSSNIYRIKYMTNLIATGKTGDKDFIEDYISIINGKLNINKYLGTNNINKNIKKANVTINVEKVDYYMDYMDIKLKIKNERKTSIMLNDRDNSENIYVEDDRELKYTAYLHELTDEEFIIEPSKQKELSIRFDIPYTKSGEIESLNIMNMIADYEQYQNTENSRLIQFNIEL